MGSRHFPSSIDYDILDNKDREKEKKRWSERKLVSVASVTLTDL